MELKLVNHSDPILKQKCEDWDYADPPYDPIELAQEMVKSIYEWNAVGLAANQVGIPYRVFAMRGSPENFVCFNPRIIDSTSEEVLLEEACLSYPGLIVKVKRPKSIKVR